MSKLVLPRINDKGQYTISYSQIKLWHDLKGFSTGLLGKFEYIRSYMMGETYPDVGWAQFGIEVEDYVCERKHADKFTEQERAVMEKIVPLGNFQVPIDIDFKDFRFIGYKDDANDDESILRDYKTASVKSKEQYYGDGYKQLNLYALDTKKKSGKLPNELQVTVIERLGNAFRGGRDVLSVGENVWEIQKEIDPVAIDSMEDLIVNTAREISEYYAIYLEMNKLVG